MVGIALGGLALAPATALACPVCALVGTSDNAWAYMAMTVMLMVLPLGMIGGAVFWIARLTARADAERSPSSSVDSDAIGFGGGVNVLPSVRPAGVLAGDVGTAAPAHGSPSH